MIVYGFGRFERLALAVMRRGRGRPKKYWGEVIRQNTTQLQIFEDMALYRTVWRSSTRVEGLEGVEHFSPSF